MSQEELFLVSAPAGPSDSDVKETKGRSRLGVIFTGLLGGSLVALYAVAAPFVAPALRKICLPFVPATTAQTENVLRVLRARSGTLVDIGSGDGRIVSALLFNPGSKWRQSLKQLHFNCKIIRASVTIINDDDVVCVILQSLY